MSSHRLKLQTDAYDGVYTVPQDRVKGGGCLSLKEHFAKWCGLDKDQFSGSWDLGHMLQLVYGDAIKKKRNVAKFLKLMYKVMGDYKIGKCGVRFRELAEELNRAVLTMKEHQDTRWVRAVLRCLQTLLRNLPTIGLMYAVDVEIHYNSGDLTKQKAAERSYNKLADVSFVAFAVGLCQILEGYAKVSVSVQDMRLHPSSVPEIFEKLYTSLHSLSENWYWEESKLKLAGIGSPLELIKEMKEEGTYSPYISEGAQIHAAVRLNISRSYEADMARKLSDLSAMDINDILKVQIDDPEERDATERDVANNQLRQATAGHSRALEVATDPQEEDSESSDEGEAEESKDAESESNVPGCGPTVSQQIAARPKAVAADITGGSLVFTRCSETDIKAVEKKLEKVAADICKSLKERVHIPPLINAMHQAFQGIEAWYNPDRATADRVIQEKISNIMSELHSARSEEFQENQDNIV